MNGCYKDLGNGIYRIELTETETDVEGRETYDLTQKILNGLKDRNLGGNGIYEAELTESETDVDELET